MHSSSSSGVDVGVGPFKALDLGLRYELIILPALLLTCPHQQLLLQAGPLLPRLGSGLLLVSIAATEGHGQFCHPYEPGPAFLPAIDGQR